ncbi:MAG: hypothetical protein F4X97_06530 [Boseongicola sp. SB0662_bin_57]|nr:hypothetical protein [Boseongicola sp. SB0662_bin_57]
MSDISLSRFLELHDLLAEQHPKSIDKAKGFAGSTIDPNSAMESEVWRILWDKPLFANARVKTAKGWRSSIKKEMKDSWRTWGEKPDEFDIRKDKPGRRSDCFVVRGDTARSFVSRYTIPLHRLYAIQGAAKALCLRASTRHGRPPFDDLPGRPLPEVVDDLCDKFGWGWGRVTVLHALTDMGLAVKPDLHVTNTVRHLGLDSRDPLEINEHVVELLRELGKSGRDDIPKSIRYIDKVLMEISRKGTIGKSSDSLAEDILDVQRRLDRIEERLGLSGDPAV